MKIMWMILGLCLVAGVFAEPAADLEDGIVEVEDDGLDVNILGENQDRKLPKTQEELMEMLESLKGATDEEKEKFMNSIGGKDVKQTSGGSGGFLYQTFTLLGLLSIIGCIFSFFGYKLYKSLVDRDLRREMKKKQKELKKRK